MGAAFPLQASYIMLNGAALPSYWCIYAHAGIVVMGLGDTFACIIGTIYGHTKWRPAVSNKTQEGSSWFIITSSVAYYLIINVTAPNHMILFLCVVFALIPTAMLEGNTCQNDNLIVSVFFYSILIFFFEFFKDY